MARAGYLVLTSNRPDQADWLTEMLDGGWKLVSVYDGLFYFENMDVIVARTAEAMQRGWNENGPIRGVIETAADSGVARALREV